MTTYRDPATLYRSATTYRGTTAVVGTGLPTDATEPTNTRWFTVDGDSVYPSFPDIRIALAFGISPFDSQIATTPGIWTDITHHVHAPTGVRISRGRSTEYDGPQPGECTFTIRDLDRSFDPLNGDSIYTGHLTPRTPVRITATYDGIDYQLFTGFVEGFPQNYDVADRVTMVDVVAHDMLSLVAGARWLPARPAVADDQMLGITDYGNRLSGTVPELDEIRSGARVAELLDVLGIPAVMTDVDDGQTVLRGGPVSEDSIYAHLANIVATELGTIYVKGDGTVRYGERTYIAEEPAALWLDSEGWAIAYQSLTLDPFALQDMKNEVTRGNGIFDPVTAKNVVSATTYGTLSDERTDLLFATPGDAKDQAQYLVGMYADPRPRIRTMSVKPQRWPRYLWPGVLGWDLTERFVVGRTPLGIGAPFVQTVGVARIEHEFTSTDWTTTYTLIQPDTSPYARCDSEATGRADDGNVAAY